MRSWVMVSLVLFCACGDKAKTPEGGGPAVAMKKPVDAATAPYEQLRLEKEGVTVFAPVGAKASALGGVDALGGQCQAMMLVSAPGAHLSYENYSRNIEKGNSGGKPTKMRRSTKTSDDDFVIEWESEGKWGYQRMAPVGDKVISCGRVSRTEVGHDCVVKVCESVKP